MQQLDILADFGTKSYIVGSTNSLLLQQKDRYSDILINLDEGTINITSTSLKAALQLSTPDRRWIDFITQNVNDTWDEANPGRPKTMGYVGSEEFIRVQFEEYLLSLISSVKYHNHLAKHANNPRMLLPYIEGDPSTDFGSDFVEAWSKTENYRIWNSHTDSHLFDIVEPKHPCAGGLTIEDVQRRITQQVQDMHWDEKLAQGKEALGRNLAAGKEKASNIFNKLYADMEAMREAQRKKAEEARIEQEKAASQQQAENRGGSPDSTASKITQNSQATAQSVGSKAGAFVNSWATWAGEKRRKAWGGGSSTPPTPTTVSPPESSNGGGGGWTSGWVKNKNRQSQMSTRSTTSVDGMLEKETKTEARNPTYSRLPEEKQPLAAAGNRGSVAGSSISGESLFDSPVATRQSRPLSQESVILEDQEPGGIDGVVSSSVSEEKKSGPMNGNGPLVVKVAKDEGGDDEGIQEAQKTPLPSRVAADEAAKAQSAWER